MKPPDREGRVSMHDSEQDTDRRFPHSKLAKLLHYNGGDLNSIGRRTGVCLFDYGMTPQEWRSSQHGKSG